MEIRLAVISLILAGLCGAWMIACGDSPAEPDDGLDPIPVALDVSNEDGEIGPGFFSAAKDDFEVGEGGSQLPDALVYEISVTNNLATPGSRDPRHQRGRAALRDPRLRGNP